MFCKYCGKTLDEGTVFCKYCGKKLDAAQPAPTAPPPGQTESAPPPRPAPPPRQAEYAPAPPRYETPPSYAPPRADAYQADRPGEKKKRTGAYVALAVSVAALLGAIVFGLGRFGVFDGGGGANAAQSSDNLTAASTRNGTGNIGSPIVGAWLDEEGEYYEFTADGGYIEYMWTPEEAAIEQRDREDSIAYTGEYTLTGDQLEIDRESVNDLSYTIVVTDAGIDLLIFDRKRDSFTPYDGPPWP